VCKEKAGYAARTRQSGEILTEFFLQGSLLGVLPAVVFRFNQSKLKKKKCEKKKKAFYLSAQIVLADS